MSEKSAKLLAAYGAWNRGDLDSWLEVMHPEVVLDLPGIFPGFDPVYRGHARIAEFWRLLREPWETFRIDVDRIEEDGDCFVVAIRFRARGVGSGVDVDMRYGHGIRLQDGLAIEIFARGTPEEAWEALRERQPACGRQA
jgi:ketosteroid isomerase-like protein